MQVHLHVASGRVSAKLRESVRASDRLTAIP